MKRFLLLLFPIIAVLAGGCATEVVVEGAVPAPLREPLPADVNLVLDEAFRSYSYVEEEGKREVSFAMGGAQSAMFRTVAGSLFRELRETTEVTPAANSLSLYPRVEAVQLATPFGNQLKVFEVWIKYDIAVFDHRGEPLADWVMTAYGKTPTRFLGSDEAALNQAAMVALRDAGARLTLEFPRVPEIRNWLKTNGYSDHDKGE